MQREARPKYVDRGRLCFKYQCTSWLKRVLFFNFLLLRLKTSTVQSSTPTGYCMLLGINHKVRASVLQVKSSLNKPPSSPTGSNRYHRLDYCCVATQLLHVLQWSHQQWQSKPRRGVSGRWKRRVIIPIVMWTNVHTRSQSQKHAACLILLRKWNTKDLRLVNFLSSFPAFSDSNLKTPPLLVFLLNPPFSPRVSQCVSSLTLIKAFLYNVSMNLGGFTSCSMWHLWKKASFNHCNNFSNLLWGDFFLLFSANRKRHINFMGWAVRGAAQLKVFFLPSRSYACQRAVQFKLLHKMSLLWLRNDSQCLYMCVWSLFFHLGWSADRDSEDTRWHH